MIIIGFTSGNKISLWYETNERLTTAYEQLTDAMEKFNQNPSRCGVFRIESDKITKENSFVYHSINLATVDYISME